jgi:hypothetical protein
MRYILKIERSFEDIEEFKEIQFRKIIFIIAKRLIFVQYQITGM